MNKVIIVLLLTTLLIINFNNVDHTENNDEIEVSNDREYNVELSIERFFTPLSIESKFFIKEDETLLFQETIHDFKRVIEEVEEKKNDPFILYDIPLDEELQRYIYNLSQEGIESNDNLSYELVLSVINLESNYKFDLISTTQDYGLMQLNKPSNTLSWLKGIAEKDLGISEFNWKDPYHNATVGIWYLKYLRGLWRDRNVSEKDEYAYTLLSYNMGDGNAKKYIKNNSPYNWKYVKRVFEIQEGFN